MDMQGKYIFEHKNKKMALLMANNSENIVLSYRDILIGTIKINDYSLKKYDIYVEWKNNVDDFETKITEFNKEYPLIMKYANYYIGLAENAIQLLGEIKNISEKGKYLGRIIEENEYNCKNYMNPFTYVETIKLFDVANYFKYKLYIDEIDYEELEKVKDIIEDEEDKKIFIAIIVYPKEALERMNKILLEQIDEKEMNKYIIKIKKIEDFIKYVQENLLEVNYIKWLEEK